MDARPAAPGGVVGEEQRKTLGHGRLGVGLLGQQALEGRAGLSELRTKLRGRHLDRIGLTLVLGQLTDEPMQGRGIVGGGKADAQRHGGRA